MKIAVNCAPQELNGVPAMLSTFRNIELDPALTGNTRSPEIGNCSTFEPLGKSTSGSGNVQPSDADWPMTYAHCTPDVPVLMLQ